MAELFYSLSVTGDCTNLSNGAIDISIGGATPPYNVQWVTPDLGYDLAVYSSFRNNLSYGTYSVVVTDSSLPVNYTLLLNVPVSNGVCCYVSGVQGTTCGLNNGIVTGTSSSDYSITTYYLFGSGSTLITSAVTSENIVNFQFLTAGTYYMVAQDIGGCTGRSETFVIEDSTPLDFGLYVVNNAACGLGPLGKIYVTGETGTAPFTYLWNNGQTTSSITGLSAGEYSVSVTDNLGCSKSGRATITNVPPISIVEFQSIPPSCLSNDGSLTVITTGGTLPFYYSASTGYVEISYSPTLTLSGLGTGFYGFLITDAAYCTTSGQIYVATPEGMSSVSVSITNSNCSYKDGSIGVSVVGGNNPYTYTLTYPDTSTQNVTTNLQFNLFTGLSGGTYLVSVVDSSGCTFTGNYTVSAQSLFTISTTTTGTTYGQTNGSIEVITYSGGTAPYNYSLDGIVNILDTALTAVTFNGVSYGQHTISVSDAIGCTQTIATYVDYTPPVDFILYPTNAGTGSGGTITTLISSGVPPFTFYWSDNVLGNPQTIMVENLTAGTYSLTIVDSNNSSLKRQTVVVGSQSFSSYETYVMGEKTFELDSNSKYGPSKMFNEGYYDLTSGNTGCVLSSATFTTVVIVNPYGTEITDTFYTSTSLLDYPADNLWYDSIQNLLMTVIGVGDVIINEENNQILITSDNTNYAAATTIDLKVYLVIDYNINCAE
jgi:uncharacterized protein (DUF2141 family)